jgi:hypothetical protein
MIALFVARFWELRQEQSKHQLKPFRWKERSSKHDGSNEMASAQQWHTVTILTRLNYWAL